MKILVINGSPKGKNSITLHTCLFLEKKFPGHTFTYIDAGQKIKALEKDFSPALEARAQVGGNFLAGVASDEGDVDKDIDTLAATVAYAMEKQYTPPQNFLGVGPPANHPGYHLPGKQSLFGGISSCHLRHVGDYRGRGDCLAEL